MIFNQRVNDDTSMMLVAAKKKIEQCTGLYRNKEYTETGIETCPTDRAWHRADSKR